MPHACVVQPGVSTPGRIRHSSLPRRGWMKAVGIVRVSRVGDREGENFRSPEDQQARIEQLCADQGWQLLDTHHEMNVSGGALLESRPGLSQAVMAVQTGRA